MVEKLYPSSAESGSGRLARFEVLFDSKEGLTAFKSFISSLYAPECMEIFVSSFTNISTPSSFFPADQPVGITSLQQQSSPEVGSLTLSISVASSCQDPLAHAKSVAAICSCLNLDIPSIYHLSNREIKVTLPFKQLQIFYPVLLKFNRETSIPPFDSVFFYNTLTDVPSHIIITPVSTKRLHLTEHSTLPQPQLIYLLTGFPSHTTDMHIRKFISDALGYPLATKLLRWGTIGSFKKCKY